MEEDGVMLPVISIEIDYKQPVFYDEEMHINVTLFDKPMIRLQTYYEIYTQRQKKPHVKGRVALCFMDSDTRKPVKAPMSFLEKFET